LLIDKSIGTYNLFPYHLSDVVTKGLRITPFNFYIEVLAHLLKLDKSYDTLPNFTAADILRVIGIGRNEYLTILSEMKTKSNSKLFRKPNPYHFLPKFPSKITIDDWWRVEVGLVLESDIKFVNDRERSVIDDLIDFGSQTAGNVEYNVVHVLHTAMYERKQDIPRVLEENRIELTKMSYFIQLELLNRRQLRDYITRIQESEHHAVDREYL
jgi:hypothetical protein